MIPLAFFLIFIALFMFITGLWMAVRGWRGVPEFSEPYCGKCGYDLRGCPFNDGKPRCCPECGADLSKRQAVLFGGYARRPRLIIAGVGIAMMPVLVVLAMIVPPLLGIRWEDLKSNGQVIAELATTADQPWTWQKLEERYRRGRLSKEEVAKAIDELIAHFDKVRQKRGPQPLFWSGEFLAMAERNGCISSEQQLRLYQAYYGPTPTVEAEVNLHPGQPLLFTVSHGSPWNIKGVKSVKALRQVQLPNGKAASIESMTSAEVLDPERLSYEGSMPIRGKIPLDLPPGEHELTFVVDVGILPETSPNAGTRGLPGQRQRWLNPVQAWTCSIPVKVTIRPAGEAVNDRGQDAALEPMTPGESPARK